MTLTETDTSPVGGASWLAPLQPDLLPGEVRKLTVPEETALWRLFVQIGMNWRNVDKDDLGSTRLKSSWLEFIDCKTTVAPSYVAEYTNAIAVIDELIVMYGETDAYRFLFFGSGVSEGPPRTRLAHAKKFVVDEFIRVQVVASGFRGFFNVWKNRGKNYNGFLRGSRYNWTERVRCVQAGRREEVTAEQVEYLFIGSGVAGATVARRLLEHDHGTSILMLEAGPEIAAKNRRHWWDYVVHNRRPYDHTYDQANETESVGNTRWDFAGNRVVAYGGSTLHWGGWCLRLQPEDFHLLENTGEGGNWPFEYDDLAPFYDRAEDFLSVCGNHNETWNARRADKPYPLPPFEWTAADGEMIRAFESLKIEPGRMPIARYRKCMATGTCKYCPIGGRFTAQYVLEDLRHDNRYENFKVRCEAPVTRILFNSKKQARGAEFIDPVTHEARQVHAQTVIVCSGAYESPKLLMLSGDTYWPSGVGEGHALLGRYLVTHSILVVRGVNTGNEECWFQEYDFPTLMSRTYDSPRYQKEGKLFLFKNRALPNVDFADLMIKGKSRSEIKAILTGPRIMELQAFLEEKGRKDNRVMLGSGKRSFGLPCTKVDFNRNAQDVADVRKHLEPHGKGHPPDEVPGQVQAR